MTEENVDYRVVQIHYSKSLMEHGFGFEYTDDKDEASLVCTYLQTYFKDGSEFDIDKEKEFEIKKLGHDEAVKKAEEYAEELAEKYNTDWEWY